MEFLIFAFWLAFSAIVGVFARLVVHREIKPAVLWRH